MSITKFTEPNEDGEKNEITEGEDFFSYALMIIFLYF